MKTKERLTKILSWWLIISMVMQMLPFSVISAFAQDNTGSAAEKTFLDINTGTESGKESDSGKDTEKDAAKGQASVAGETKSNPISGEEKQWEVSAGGESPTFYKDGEQYELPTLSEEYVWLGSDGKTYASGQTITINSNISFQAVPVSTISGTKSGDRDVVYYTVTWIIDEDEEGQASIESGKPLSSVLPSSPSKEGDYRFKHWESAGAVVSPETLVESDMTLTAIFEPVEYVNVTFTAGESSDTVRVEKDTAIGSALPSAPQKEGYRFDGWFMGETPVDEETEFSGDAEVTAQYTKLFTVTFDPTIPGDVPQLEIEVVVADGETVGSELPGVPENPGYIGSWVLDGTETAFDADTIVRSDLAVETHYELIQYTATFVQEDGTSEEITVSINDDYAVSNLPRITEKTHYVAKWVYQGTTNEFTDGTVISEDVTLEAYYEQNVFTVTFKVGDKVYDTNTVFKNANITLPTAPEKEGRTAVRIGRPGSLCEI